MPAEETTESKKPSNSAFKQQRLPAWQPILTPKTVLPTLFVIGAVFIPLGIGFYVTSQGVNELTMDYTNCDQAATIPAPDNVQLWSFNSATKNCTLQFQLPNDFSGPVYIYYRLTNFYQNNRRYVKSVSVGQLQGQALSSSQIGSDCDPLTTINNTVIYPCGLIANSIFNDTIYGPYTFPDGTLISFSETGIAWSSDLSKYGTSSYQPSQVVPPPNWSSYNGTYTVLPTLGEHFAVWMRTAGLPTFRKLWSHSGNTLPGGTYTMVINFLYDVRGFQGTKAIVISTSSWLGGKNIFLGVAYMTVGSLAILLGVLFLVKHMISPRKLGDPAYLSWNRGR